MLRLILMIFLLIPVCCNAASTEGSFELWGADKDLAFCDKQTVSVQKPKLTPAQKTCRSMIRFFQVYISPIDGPRSSFYPTSSQYALEAIEKYGVLTGIALGCDRLLRENSELWVYECTDKHGMKRKLDPVP